MLRRRRGRPCSPYLFPCSFSILGYLIDLASVTHVCYVHAYNGIVQIVVVLNAGWLGIQRTTRVAECADHDRETRFMLHKRYPDSACILELSCLHEPNIEKVHPQLQKSTCSPAPGHQNATSLPLGGGLSPIAALGFLSLLNRPERPPYA